MKTRSLVLAGGLGLALAAMLIALLGQGAPTAAQAAPLAQATGGFITITVKAGESLATYPRIYGTSGSAILAANPDLRENPALLFPGQVIVIPVVRTFTPSLTTPFFYTAQANDTLAAVARRFELDPAAIARVNGVAEFTPGVTYLMPAGPHLYFLKPGDTIGTVAGRYGVTQQVILDANSIPNPGVLYAGQPIFIPVLFDAAPRPIPADLATATGTPAATATATPVGAATATPSVPTGFIQVTVQPGDTLLTYVQRFNVSARAIIDANPVLRENPSLIFPGQKLLIPAPLVTPTATPTTTATGGPTATPGPSATPSRTPAPNLTPAPNTLIQTVVRRGDSLVTFALRYGVSGSSLLAVNPQLRENPGLIFPGQVLTIPVVASFTPSRTTPFFYVVQAGETAPSIAAKMEMTVDTLLKANPGVAFISGATILVPAGPHVYSVKAGDDLRKIAVRYGTTVEALLTGNNLPNPDLIYVGQEMFIPIQYNAAPLPFTP